MIRSHFINPDRLISVVRRKGENKPPLVSWSGRSDRKKWNYWWKRYLFRITVKVFFGTYKYNQFKWRWCRGEIKDRRLFTKKWGEILGRLLARKVNYVDLGRKLLTVEDLKGGTTQGWE